MNEKSPRWLSQLPRAGVLQGILYCTIISLAAFSMFIFAKQQVLPGISGPLTFDGQFYSGIRSSGYHFNGNIEEKQNIAFLPLNAALMVVADVLVPGKNAFLEVALIGFFVLLITLIGIFILAADYGGKHAAAIAVALWAISPVGFYNFVGYAEPIYAMLTVWILLATKKNLFWTASILAGIALLGRPQAIVLVGFVGVMLMRQAGWRIDKALQNHCGWKAFLALAPLMIYASWNVLQYDDAIVYVNALEAWRRGSLMDGNLNPIQALNYFFHAISSSHPVMTHWTAMLGMLSLALVSITLFYSMTIDRPIRWLYWSMLAFWFSVASFDAMNSARHLFFMVPWVIIVACTSAKFNAHLVGKFLLLFPWLLTASLINFYAVIRYYQGQWVS